MENKLIEVLEKLAAKLGTTAEYLWAVLIKQAYISALTSMSFILFTIVFGFSLWKIHKSFMDDDRKMSYYNQDEALIFPMIFAAVGFAFCLIASFMMISDVIIGLTNPEYWALEKILKSL